MKRYSKPSKDLFQRFCIQLDLLGINIANVKWTHEFRELSYMHVDIFEVFTPNNNNPNYQICFYNHEEP